MQTDQLSFALDHFEGPLSFLLQLVQKRELDIYTVSLQEILEQYTTLYQQSEESLDLNQGAEFIATASFLVWLKSRMLLPRQEQGDSTELEEMDPNFEIIHHLIDYCRFKEAGKELSELEQQQDRLYEREAPPPIFKKPIGVEHLSLEDLALIFQQAMSRAVKHTGVIEEEEWKVSDKMDLLRELLTSLGQMQVDSLFPEHCSKEELIVTFLAVLELMKLGELFVIRESGIIMIIGGNRDNQGQ